MAQFLIEEAMYDAVEHRARKAALEEMPAGHSSAAALSPHEQLRAEHERKMAAGRGDVV